MVRLKFQYTKTGRFVETGTCSIDVPDDAGKEDIKALMADRKFARYLALSFTEDDVQYSFDSVEKETVYAAT